MLVVVVIIKYLYGVTLKTATTLGIYKNKLQHKWKKKTKKLETQFFAELSLNLIEKLKWNDFGELVQYFVFFFIF